MIFKNHYISIWLHVLAMLFTCLLFAFCFFTIKDILIQINIALVLFVQLYFFVKRVNRIHQDLQTFFDAARNNDTSIIFANRQTNGALNSLYQQFDAINQTIQDMRIELENRNQYFKVLVEHVGIGVISFTESGKITLCNAAAKSLFQMSNIFKLHDLESVQPGFSRMLKELKPNEQKLIRLYRNNELIQLSVKATELKILDDKLTLVSLQNIKNELDEKELDSWQKLIRILTHEIMNSIGPINSTISTLLEFLTTNGQPKLLKQLDGEIIEDAVTGLNIIEERSKGMINFVARFRDFSLLPKPEFSIFLVDDIIRSIKYLLSETLYAEGVDMEISLSNANLSVKADKSMVEQVLINLINNSLQALSGQSIKSLKVLGENDSQGGVSIEIIDNGPGIPLELQDKIFIPFFTTKKEGSGIGLSLSRQIMRLHGGTLTVKSAIGLQTVFTLYFPDR